MSFNFVNLYKKQNSKFIVLTIPNELKNRIEQFKSKTMATERTHIVKRESGWAVKKEGNEKASRIYKTKEEAIKGSEKLRDQGSDVIIHKEDGSIQDWKKSRK